jgi:hypothetical protein
MKETNMEIERSPATTGKSLEAKLHFRAPMEWKNLPQIAMPCDAALEEDFKTEIERLRQGYVGMMRGYRDALIQVIAGACAVAEYLEGNNSAWNQFCEQEIWRVRGRKPKSDRPEEALRFVLLWINSDPKRASKWYNAVQPLYASGVKPAKMASCIRRAGGIEMLAQENAEAKKSPSRAKNAESGVIKREPLTKKANFVKLRAHLQKKAKGFPDFETGIFANLLVKIGRKGPEIEITIFEAEEADPPE